MVAVAVAPGASRPESGAEDGEGGSLRSEVRRVPGARRLRRDAGDAQRAYVAAEGVHAALRVAEVVELGLAVLALDELARLDDAPHGPHRLRRGAPRAHLAVELRHLRRERGRVARGARVGEVGAVEVLALCERRVAGRVEEVWDGPVVVRRPLVEVVRDVERGRVRRRVFEIDDDDLRGARAQSKSKKGTAFWQGRQSAWWSLRSGCSKIY